MSDTLRLCEAPVHALTAGLVHYGCFISDDQLCLLLEQLGCG